MVVRVMLRNEKGAEREEHWLERDRERDQIG